MKVTDAQVVWLEEPGKLVLRKEALASPGRGEILCETLVSAISPGTELAAWRGLPPLRPSVAYPRLQGYCNVARVLQTGPDVASVEPGDRVLSFASHRSHHILAESDILYRLPHGADANKIAATYLFHLGYNAVLRSNVRPGSRVAVIGLGVLGLAAVAMSDIAGAKVVAVSNHASARLIAERYGAEACLGRQDEEGLLEALGGGADVVISTSNSWDDFGLSLRLAGQNATIACLGFPGRGQPPGDFNPLESQYFYMKQLRIEAVGWSPEHDDSRGFNRFNERANASYLAHLIESGRLDASLILSGHYLGSEIAQAYVDLEARKDNAITYLLDWSA